MRQGNGGAIGVMTVVSFPFAALHNPAPAGLLTRVPKGLPVNEFWRSDGPATVDQRESAAMSAVGAKAGGLRCFVACSNAYASLINVGSLQARPMNDIPTGKPW